MEQEKQTVLQKMFLNERGEISLRKAGTVCMAIGGYLVSGAVPGAVIISIGKGILALGGMFAALGQFAKNDRK